MRNRYIVSYDVREPKRLRRAHKKMQGFGDPLQYSGFACNLSKKELAMMEEAISEVVNLREDSVLIIDAGPVGGRGSESMKTLGAQIILPVNEADCVIVGLAIIFFDLVIAHFGRY